MSVNPYDKAHELARSIMDSDVFKQYEQIRVEISNVPELQERISQLRLLQMEINRAHILGEETPSSKVQEAALEFALLNQDTKANAYFEAESGFIRMFSDIQGIIQNALQAKMGKEF